VILPGPGAPSTGIGYIFYAILIIIGYLGGYHRKTSKLKRAKYIVPAALFFTIFGILIFLITLRFI
jgi:hypothetical protein